MFYASNRQTKSRYFRAYSLRWATVANWFLISISRLQSGAATWVGWGQAREEDDVFSSISFSWALSSPLWRAPFRDDWERVNYKNGGRLSHVYLMMGWLAIDFSVAQLVELWSKKSEGFGDIESSLDIQICLDPTLVKNLTNFLKLNLYSLQRLLVSIKLSFKLCALSFAICNPTVETFRFNTQIRID